MLLNNNNRIKKISGRDLIFWWIWAHVNTINTIIFISNRNENEKKQKKKLSFSVQLKRQEQGLVHTVEPTEIKWNSMHVFTQRTKKKLIFFSGIFVGYRKSRAKIELKQNRFTFFGCIAKCKFQQNKLVVLYRSNIFILFAFVLICNFEIISHVIAQRLMYNIGFFCVFFFFAFINFIHLIKFFLKFSSHK